LKKQQGILFLYGTNIVLHNIELNIPFGKASEYGGVILKFKNFVDLMIFSIDLPLTYH